MFLGNRRACFGLLSIAMIMIFVSFKQAFMTVVLKTKYGVGEEYHGFIISLPALFYIISGNLVGIIVDKAPRRFFILFAFFLIGLSNFLMGPSAIFSMPRELWIYFVGYAINGFA